MNKKTIAKACRITGKATILAPIIALATQYPVIQQVEATGGGTVLSSIITLGIIIVLLANISYLKKLSTNPSAVMVYGFIFVICLGLQNLIDPLLIISGAGLGGALGKEGLTALSNILEGTKADNAIKELIKGVADER